MRIFQNNKEHWNLQKRGLFWEWPHSSYCACPNQYKPQKTNSGAHFENHTLQELTPGLCEQPQFAMNYVFCSTFWTWTIPAATWTALLSFSCSVASSSLWPHGLQYTRLPCPPPSPRACSNSPPSSWWCHPTISCSVVPFSSCPQSFPASGLS